MYMLGLLVVWIGARGGGQFMLGRIRRHPPPPRAPWRRGYGAMVPDRMRSRRSASPQTWIG